MAAIRFEFNRVDSKEIHKFILRLKLKYFKVSQKDLFFDETNKSKVTLWIGRVIEYKFKWKKQVKYRLK